VFDELSRSVRQGNILLQEIPRQVFNGEYPVDLALAGAGGSVNGKEME